MRFGFYEAGGQFLIWVWLVALSAVPLQAREASRPALDIEPVIFSVTADAPYDSAEVGILQQHLDNHDLYSPSEFFFHLGDIKLGTAPCDESYYSDMAAMLRSLSVPAFIVPGDNEVTDCLDRVVAWQYWTTHLMGIESSFCGVPTVDKQDIRPENFAFVHKGVLFVGINLVGGVNLRAVMDDDADWIHHQFTTRVDSVHAAVVLSQAGPAFDRNLFFDQFVLDATAFAKPILYIHGDGHIWMQDQPFTALNVTRVQTDRGHLPPVEVTVHSDGTFVFDRDPWPAGTQPLDRPPCAEAGPNLIIPTGGVATLTGMASDDGEPLPPQFSALWSLAEGPDDVDFGDPSAPATTATFEADGTYTLRLTATDGVASASDEMSVLVGAQGPNIAPLAARDVFEVDVDQTLWVEPAGVLANDTDANGDALVASVLEPPAHGELNLDADGGFIYVPEPGYAGLDRFLYRASDTVASSDAEAWIGVGGAVVSFVATADAKVRSTSPNNNYGNTPDLRIEEDNPTYHSYLKFNVTGVGPVRDGLLLLRAQASSADGGALYSVSNNYASSATPWTETGITWANAPAISGVPIGTLGPVPSNARVEFDLGHTIQGPGVWSFGLRNSTPDAINYGSRESSRPPELLLVALHAGADFPPVAAVDAYDLSEDLDLLVSAPGVLANDVDEDGDSLTVSLAAPPTHGVVDLAANGSFTYAPDPDYFGVDAFSYVVDDGRNGTDTGIVTITIAPVSDPPVVTNDEYRYTAGVPLMIPAPGLLENDDDADGDSLGASIVEPPARGNVDIAADGSFVYTPSGTGWDRFTYQVTDGLATATGLVTLIIERSTHVEHVFSPSEDQTPQPSGVGSTPEGRAGAASGDPTSCAYPGHLTFDVRGLGNSVVLATLYLPDTPTIEGSRPATDDVCAGHQAQQLVAEKTSLAGNAVIALDVTSSIHGDGLYHYAGPNGQVRPNGRTGQSPRLVILALPRPEPEVEATPRPLLTTLERVRPNPFRHGTWIDYSLARDAHVEISIHDVRGRRVRTLLTAREISGRRSVFWDGKNNAGAPVATGVYFLRARLDDRLETRKIVLQR